MIAATLILLGYSAVLGYMAADIAEKLLGGWFA